MSSYHDIPRLRVRYEGVEVRSSREKNEARITTMTISDPQCFVDCDGCRERVDFSFSLILDNDDWKQHPYFEGWEIDWSGPNGDARCPKCKDHGNEEDP